MRQYLDILREIRRDGVLKESRAGNTLGLFSLHLKHDMREGFPLLTTKKMGIKTILGELLWFISGSTDIRDLRARNVHIWDDDCYRRYVHYMERQPTVGQRIMPKEEFFAELDRHDEKMSHWADMGPMYGHQWRDFNGTRGITRGIDQLQVAIDKIRNQPMDRRNLVTAWNPVDVPLMALPACHILFQFCCGPDNTVSLGMYQRSCDTFLGVPFNIASYALLLEMIAKITGRVAHELAITFGDVHIYENHLDAVDEQLSREARPLPRLEISGNQQEIEDFKVSDFKLVNYDPHPAIRAKLSVGL